MSSSQAKTSASTGKTRTVSTKQVHPVTLSSFTPTGCDLSTWAYITLPRPNSNINSNGQSCSQLNDNGAYPYASLPNLVTAHANSLKIYVLDPISGTLILASSYDNLAGIITTLDTLPNAASSSSNNTAAAIGSGNSGTKRNTNGQSYDGLLIGFAGQPRMSIVYPPGGVKTGNWNGVLTASSIIDLTPALTERSLGCVSPLEQDLFCSVTEDGKVPTVAVVLGGGVSIAAFQLPRSNYLHDTATATNGDDDVKTDVNVDKDAEAVAATVSAATETKKKNVSSSWWRTASEPYFLPLSSLSSALPVQKSTSKSALYNQSKYHHRSSAQTQTAAKLSHGFGDIISSAFLRGYTEPVLAILHSNPHRYGGRACEGRLGHHASSTRTPLCLTAISISVVQRRSVVLWSLPDAIPSDAFACHPHPKGGVLVVGVNQVLYVDCAGKPQCCTAVNGWVRSTGSAALLPKVGAMGGIIQPNPSPLAKLSLQLDGCRLSFVNENVAMLSLRDGTLYSVELHEEEEAIGVGGMGGGMCMSISPVGQKLGGVGMVSTLSALPLVHIHTMGESFKKFFDDKSIVNTKKEEMDKDDTINKGAKEKLMDVEASSLGLIFAGSRMGDSILMMYGVKEKVKLVPLKRDSEQEKAIAKAVEMSEQNSKRKREDEETRETTIKKEKLEDDVVGASGTEAKQGNGAAAAAVSDDDTHLSEEEILRREDEALYAPDSDDEERNAFIPLSDKDGSNETLLPGITQKQLYRPQIRSMSIFQQTTVLDSLTGLGPVGPGCTGPTAGKEPKDIAALATNIAGKARKGSVTNVHPCGFGPSGGLAVLKTPGLHAGSTVVSETDCLNIGPIFPCPNLGYFFVVRNKENEGCIIMKVTSGDGERGLEEIDLESVLDVSMDIETPIPSFSSVRDVLTRMTVINVKEFKSRAESKCADLVVLVVRYGSAHALVILSQIDGKFFIEHSHFVGAHDDGQSFERENLISASFVEHLDSSRSLSAGEDLSLACVWSSGHASAFSISFASDDNSWVVKELLFDKVMQQQSMDVGAANEDYESSNFYQDGSIVAIDIFAVADSIFETDGKPTDVKSDEDDESYKKVVETFKFDEDDLELYGEEEIGEMTNGSEERVTEQEGQDSGHSQMAPSRYNTLGGYISGAGLSETSKVVVAISRRSGCMEIYDVAKLFIAFGESIVKTLTDSEEIAEALLWSTESGCGQGAPSLSTCNSPCRRPKVQESCAAEMRFYFSGPSNTHQSNEPVSRDLSILRSLCLIIETNQGDQHLYSASRSNSSGAIAFKRVSLHSVARPSKEESKHRNKLRRKGMTNREEGDGFMYRRNRLHRFFSISGQDGLFAATARPQWFLSERGAPSVLCHRLRHCAPAGGAEVPVSGFCTGFSLGGDMEENVGFITVHDRIGRVGSQRLTLFNGLSDVFTKHGLLPGGGISVEKIPLGVTVRHIHHIDDPAISTASHPVYALLISREVQIDQTALIDDGLTSTQRQEIKDEKERKRMAKQVEADLGGFDVEQEWVEEIEREDCFEVEKRYGGAPPIPQSMYEVWIMDSHNWQILDTYQLDEYEHGMSMKVMPLSDIAPDTTGGSTNAEDESFHDTIQVLALGTGIIDQDGEDVSSKGRILLFQLRRIGDRTANFELELDFVYDKEISLGPVTSINCLTAEGKSRMVVGAGAEITIEQWGGGKLTQVGFFHCYMQVQDVVIFKNFLILSDAYDSIHFLVYRESDKSLTLLAKDYEPTSVYAAGLLSRGGTLQFVCHDDRQNLTFLSYAPNDAAARGGNKLVCRADCHLGTQTTAMQSHFCRSSLVVNSATTESTLVALRQQDSLHGKSDDDQRFGLHYGSIDGGFGTIVPVNEGVYWRLAALQSVMSNALESDCSLSHRAWRLYRRSPRRGGCRSNDRKKGVVDGDLVMKYADLPISEQEDLASAIGSTVDLILDNLLELGVSSMVI